MLGKLSTKLTTLAVAAAISLGTLVASTTPSSARVVCNRWGQCWHVHRPYYYGAYYGYGPYYDPYYYDYGYYGPYYGPAPYNYGPAYGGYYYGPSIGFGFTFGGGGHHHWHH